MKQKALFDESVLSHSLLNLVCTGICENNFHLQQYVPPQTIFLTGNCACSNIDF